MGMLACLMAIAPAIGAAARPSDFRTRDKTVLSDFASLAQMRPRQCSAGSQVVATAPGWQASETHCAWRGRLMMRSWIAQDALVDGCIGPAAYWWRWIHAQAGAVAPAPWHGSWTSQQVEFDRDGAKSLAILVRAEDGKWIAREWFWNPSERAATRRWQQGRWDLLVAASSRLRLDMPAQAAGQQRWLKSAWVRSIGDAPAEIVADQWRWQAAGRCLAIDSIGASEGGFQLPYLVEDSRLEQRSAMQVLLARRHPGATWLKSFSLIDDPSQRKDGPARYFAVWREQDMVRGQLWIPTKANGPVHRLRLSTEVQPGKASGPGGSSAPQAVEQELKRLSKLLGNVDG